MCSSDSSVVTYNWSEKAKVMKPKLGNVHMCRNFTKLQDWALEHYVSVQSLQTHVEDGYVVDYSHSHPLAVKPEDENIPVGWNKTIEDM